MSKSVAAGFVLFLVLSLSSTPVALAQATETGSLRGTVTDQQGGLIPGAEILAKDDQTGSQFRAMSNERGIWEISSVPVGSYTVSVNAQGFQTADLPEIKVDAGITVTKDATLQVGFAKTITVTASKFEQEVINAPAAVSVVSDQAIQALPSQNVTDLLREVPGMNVVQTSAASFGVTARAATAAMPNAQLALVDGRTLYQDYLGFVSWNVIPTNLDEIKQIEVIRGPASAVWGAYAMNGVVNIITKPPREMLGTTFTLGVGTFDRSGGEAPSDTGYLYYGNVTHAQALNDQWAFKISGGGYTQDAFARPQGTYGGLQVPYPPFKNEGTTQPKVDTRVDYDLPDGRQHLTFEGGFASSTGIQHGGFGGTRGDMSASYGKIDYTRDTLKIMGYVNIFSTDGTYLSRIDPTGQPLRWIADNHAVHFEFSNIQKIGAKHLISYGGSFRHADFEIADAPGAKSRNEVGLYMQDEVILSEHFRWIAGARIDKSDFLDGVVFSPRTTFMVKPTPGQTFRVSYNRAYVAPAVFIKYWQVDVMSWFSLASIDPQLAGYNFPIRIEGNKDLQEQSLNAYEIGYAAVTGGGRLNLGAAFYINDRTGDLSFQQTGSYTSQNPPPGWPLPSYVLDLLVAYDAFFGPGLGLPSRYTANSNSGMIRDKGIELNANARLSRFIDGYANYSWQARPEAKDFDASFLNISPTNRFNAGLNCNYGRYMADVSVGYTGRAYWTDVGGYGDWTKAFTVINTVVGLRWGSGEKFGAMLKISNLANVRVQNHIYGDILKRQITGEFRMRF